LAGWFVAELGLLWRIYKILIYSFPPFGGLTEENVGLEKKKLGNHIEFKKNIVWFFWRLAVLLILLVLLEIGYNNEVFAIIGPASTQLLIHDILQKIVFTFFIWFGLATAKRIAIPTIIFAASPTLSRLVREPTARRSIFKSLSKYLTYAVYAVAVIAVVYVWAYSFLGTYIAGALGTGLVVTLTFVLGLFTSSVLGNILAYAVLDGTTEFNVGDRVQIGEDFGDVVEIGFFFTRVRTIKDEVISYPNLSIMNKEIKNYSALKNVLIYIPLTLGYDLDKEEVKRLLVKCAEMTEGIVMNNPQKKPFVLLRELGNYTITYEINAYTDQPNQFVNIKSRLIDNILGEFKKAQIEILSPTHVVIRNGHAS
jgi:small-conductance mechanosensitive channel